MQQGAVSIEKISSGTGAVPIATAFEKSAIFALSLKQMSSSSFHMFIYAGSKQCDLIRGPTYLLII